MRTFEAPVRQEKQVFEAADGRAVIVHLGDETESIEIRGTGGDAEVVITFTENGPRVQLRAASIHVETPRDVVLECDKFRLDAPQGIELSSEQRIDLQGEETLIRMNRDVDLRGRFIRLNSPEKKGDVNEPAPPAAAPEKSDCGCNHQR